MEQQGIPIRISSSPRPPSSSALLDSVPVAELITALADRAGTPHAESSTAEAVRSLCRDLAALVEQHLGRRAGGVERLPERLEKAGMTPGEVLREIMTGGAQALPRLAETLSVDLAGLIVFATYWARPFTRVAADAGRRSRSEGLSSACPACGCPPALARLRRDDGARMLWCATCGNEWRAPILSCPFCGNNDPGTQGVIEVETEPAVHIEHCRLCRGYLKTIDERHLVPKKFSYDSWLWSTALFDILAAEQGLSPTASTLKKEGC